MSVFPRVAANAQLLGHSCVRLVGAGRYFIGALAKQDNWRRPRMTILVTFEDFGAIRKKHPPEQVRRQRREEK